MTEGTKRSAEVLGYVLAGVIYTPVACAKTVEHFVRDQRDRREIKQMKRMIKRHRDFCTTKHTEVCVALADAIDACEKTRR